MKMKLVLSKNDKIDGRDIMKVLEDVTDDYYRMQAYVYVMALRDASIIEKRREENDERENKCT